METKSEPINIGEHVEFISYNKDSHERKRVDSVDQIELVTEGKVNWLNVYGLHYHEEFSKIIKANGLDNFLVNLISDGSHRTKVVGIKDSFFFTAKSVHFSDEKSVTLEQMMFIVSGGYIWSIQEKVGDNFSHIRERLERKIGLVRSRGTDYLMHLLLESIVDNYFKAYADLMEQSMQTEGVNWNDADPARLEGIELKKTNLFRLRRSLSNLKDALHQTLQLDNGIIKAASKKYYVELKEQVAYLVDQIDTDLSRLESATNLFFSLQSHRLNEVMKTLTILSAVFIPLTFIAGIYGMNFQHMPELEQPYGYFVVLGVMALLVVGSIAFFKKRGWF